MPLQFVRRYIKLESSAGIILFFAAVLAMIVANTSLAQDYHAFKASKVALLWINDGFMSLFFLLVGLEIKREMQEGELTTFRKAALPGVAAIGGMLLPACIYLICNMHNPIMMKGWAIPAATDTAFSLGILSLLGKRIPSALKVFLMALAIFDDVGAIIIISFFYTAHLLLPYLFAGLALVIVLAILNYCNVQRLSVYGVVGMMLWFCVLKSGVHTTIAGVILALFIPLKNPNNESKSPLRFLENGLHPWVAFAILPIFAFTNAGISFSDITWQHLFSSMPIGIALGLCLGKQLGIWGFTLFAVRSKLLHLPQAITPMGLYGMSLVAGVGFTMSLFIGTLAFGVTGSYSELVRLGVILGSVISGFLGYWVLRFAYADRA